VSATARAEVLRGTEQRTSAACVLTVLLGVLFSQQGVAGAAVFSATCLSFKRIGVDGLRRNCWLTDKKIILITAS
jgi:hypothetical protein